MRENWDKAEQVKLDNVKIGDSLIVDAGFDCMEPWSTHDVRVLDDQLYIACKHGVHFLEGQVDHDDLETLKGVRRIKDGN